MSIVQQIAATRIVTEGREMVFFGGTNYLGLSFHPAVLAALKSSLDATGFGLGVSRLTTGTSPDVNELEEFAASFAGSQDAIALGSGLQANLAVLEGLSGLVKTWVVDELAHVSFQRFLSISGAQVRHYKHCDAASCGAVVAETQGLIGVFTDAVFPLTGRAAPLAEITAVLTGREHILVADESHSFGALGEGGRGLTPSGAVVTTTLSKAVGCMGGLILGPANILERIRATSAAYSASSALGPACCQAVLAALRLIRSDPAILAGLRTNTRLMHEQLRGLPLAPRDERVPIFCMNGDLSEVHDRCKDQGMFVPLIEDYSGMTKGKILRWILQSGHTAAEINALCEVLRG